MRSSTLIKSILLTAFLLFSFFCLFSQSVSTYWKYNNPGPLGNHFYDLTYVNDQVGYACGDAGVIARTTDGGRTWTYDYTATRELLQSIQFVNETTGYAVGVNGRVMKTTNRGITWDSTASRPVTTGQLYNLFFFDANNGIVVGSPVSNTATIFKTTNGGATWTSLAAGFPVQTKAIMAISFVDANNGYVSGQSGLVAKTTNGGASWTDISLTATNPSPIGGAGILQNQSYPALGVVDAQTVIVGSQNNSYVIKTSNGGANWVVKGAQTPNAALYIPGSFQMWNMKVKGSTVAISMGNLLGLSNNSGETWRICKPYSFSHPNGSGSINFYSVDITPNNSVKMIGLYGILADSASGAPGWDQTAFRNNMYNQVDAQNLFCVSNLDANNILAGGANGTLYKSTDGGTTWINKSIPEFMPPMYLGVGISDIKYVAPDAAYMACGNGYIYRSFDGGSNWPDLYAFNTNRSVTGIDFTDANTGWICATLGTTNSSAIYRTTNGGLNWTIQNGTLTGANYLMSIDFVNNTTGWAVGGTSAKIFKTTDGGVNWTMQTAPATVAGILYTVSFANADTGYAAGAGGKVIRTIDGGNTWTDISPAGLLGTVNKIVFVNGKTGILFGGGGACYKTFDAGITWKFFTAPTNDVLAGASIMAPYNTNNNPGGPNLDMIVVGGRLIGGQVGSIYKVRVIDAAASPAAPAMINISDICVGAASAKGKILNPPSYTQIDITVDGVPVLYYPNDSSFYYYENGVTTGGLHTVRVRYTNAGGTIFSEQTFTFHANKLTPLVGITSNDADNIICESQSVTFTANPTNGGNTPSYRWKVNNAWVSTTGPVFNYVPVKGDVIGVEMTSSFACLTIPYVEDFTLPIDVPQFNPLIVSTTANLLSVKSPDNGAAYQWYRDGQPVAGATGISFKAELFGTYTVRETYRTCSKTSNAITIGGKGDIVVFPVPASTMVYVQTGDVSNTIKSVLVYDAGGRQINTEQFSNNNIIQVNIAKLPAALYFIKIETTSGVVTKKFTKQ